MADIPIVPASVVARIDRLARSLAHLLQVVEDLRARGAHFRSLADPIDTAGPSGVLVLQRLGAVAEFERSLIQERTKAGLAVLPRHARVGGNPGLRAGDPAALAKLAAARRTSRLADLLPGPDAWLPHVRQLRPALPWPEVVERVNAALPRGQRPFTQARLVRALRLLAAEGLADKGLLAATPRRHTRRGGLARTRAVEVAAAPVSSRHDAGRGSGPSWCACVSCRHKEALPGRRPPSRPCSAGHGRMGCCRRRQLPPARQVSIRAT